MIYIIDNFIEKDIFEKITNKLNNNPYTEYKTPGKSFWVQGVEVDFNQYVLNKLMDIEGKEVESILEDTF